MKQFRPINKAENGFTLVEIVVSTMILTMAIGLALTGYMYSLKSNIQSDTQAELDSNVQIAIERLKQDMRLSAMDHIYYYPAGAPPYEALSFPIAEDTDGDGMLDRDTDGYLIWNKTIIYHIREGSPDELVRTVISPREADTDFQAQLNDVVDEKNVANATAHVIFSNLLDWELNPRQGTYNGYAKATTVDKNARLGYAYIDSGTHTFTFEVIDEGEEGGHGIGIDTLRVTPSNLPREAEDLTASNQNLATVSKLEATNLTCSAGYYAVFPANATGAEFTLTVDSDRWEETNFSQGTREGTVTDDSMVTPRDIVLRLAGYDLAWEAKTQTATPTGTNPTNALNGTAVRILQKGISLPDQGGMIISEGAKCRLFFEASSAAVQIGDVYFGRSADAATLSMAYAEPPIHAQLENSSGNLVDTLNIPAGTTVSTEWIDVPINRTNNYVVSYTIADNTGADAPRIWKDQNVTDPSIGWYPTTQIATFDGTGPTAAGFAAQQSAWSSATGVAVSNASYIPGLQAMQVSYVAQGTYTSRIIDTTMESPEYRDFTWSATTPTGTDLSFKLRTDSNPDMSGAAAWTNIAAFSYPTFVTAAYERYIQFQAILTSDADRLETPILKDVTVDWPGPARLVNIGGNFVKAPDHGIFNISVDGRKLESALIVDLQIYKDVRTFNNETRRINSSAKVEINPRNSNK